MTPARRGQLGTTSAGLEERRGGPPPNTSPIENVKQSGGGRADTGRRSSESASIAREPGFFRCLEIALSSEAYR